MTHCSDQPISEPLLPNEDSRTKCATANRAVSCQLPAASEEARLGAIHRPTQSIDLGSTQVHISWSPPRPIKTEAPALQILERKKRGGGSPAVQIVALLLLVPLAFLAGYAVAIHSQGQGAHHTSSRPRSLQAGGGVGRQLTHDDAFRPPKTDKPGVLVSSANQRLLHGQDLVPQMLFVTWIAFGDFGDGGFHTHNFHKVDMRWAAVARKSHPGCKIGLVMDQDTQLQDPHSVDFLHRITIDKKVYGRNEHNDFYHWSARYSFLEKLMAEGSDNYNVVFLDPDVFVAGDIHEVFEHSGFDYATTVSLNPEQPINGAMHFVRAHRYGAAVDVLKGVLSVFQLRPEMGFTAGQQAYADFFELTDNEALVKKLQWDSVEKGIGCHSIKEGDFNICYFICTKFNFWEDCSDHPDMIVRADKPEDYEAVGVKVFHFIAYRKLGMAKVFEAFMEQGLEGAQRAWAALPHDEDGYSFDPSFDTQA